MPLQYCFSYKYCLVIFLSQKSSYDTLPLCNVLREPDGQPLRLKEKDVNEFMESCSVLKKHTHAKNLCLPIFMGSLCTKLYQDASALHIQRLEPYFMITVPVKNKESLEEGLEQLTQSGAIRREPKCHQKRDW